MTNAVRSFGHYVSMEPRLVDLSRSLDAALIGRRIRNARLAAGMTQSQATDGEVSATYLSRIEDGQRRASVGLLERLAERIGVSVESLLAPAADDTEAELRLALDHAELKLLAGDAAAALADCETIVPQVEEANLAEVTRSCRFLLARAREAVGDYNGAILLFEELAQDPAADPIWLKAAMGLTRCYRQTGDIAMAIQVGERAVQEAARLGLDGVTESVQLTVTLAAAYDVAGDSDHALRLCLKALDAAEKHGSSPVASASAYWNASMIERTRGDLVSASAYAEKALAVFEAADDNRAIAALRTSAAELHLLADPPNPEGALQQLGKAETEMGWADASDASKANLLVIKARAHLLLGNYENARDELDRASLVVPSAAAFVRADAASLAGQVAAAMGQLDEARDRYLEGIHLLSEVAADRKVSNLWYELAELLEEAGDPVASRDAYRAAAAASGATSRRRVTQLR